MSVMTGLPTLYKVCETFSSDRYPARWMLIKTYNKVMANGENNYRTILLLYNKYTIYCF